MATINEFLPFADQSTANLIPYAEWVNAAKRLTGFVSGIAKSNEMNRVFAQGAQAGYAIAKFIERTLSEDVYVSDVISAKSLSNPHAIFTTRSAWQISSIVRLSKCPTAPRRSDAS